MNIAVIFAGGIGARMQTDGLPKQFLEIDGAPIITRTLSVFQAHEDIDAIVLVMVSDWIDHMKGILEKHPMDKVASIIPGGETGQESIYHGLLETERLAKKNDCLTSDVVVLLHDGVRPVIDEELISKNIAGVEKYGSAITCVPCTETIVMVNEEGKRIIRTIEREKTRIAKAPQSFYLADILAAHKRALQLGYTNVVDSCTIMQLFGAVAPRAIEGSPENIKVTTPEDYYTLKTLLDYKAGKLEQY